MEVEYEDRLVAFIDILGFKELVNQSVASSEVMMKIYNALQTILNVKNIEEHFYGPEIVRPYQATITTFSDSIVISYLLGPYGGLFKILLDIIHLQLELAYQGVLIRGGIAIGKAYHDGQIVFGPAMNEAYALESSYAVHPRIIVKEDTLIKGIRLTHDKHHSEKEEAEFISSLVRQDKDGFCYLDFLRQSGELDYPEGDYYFVLSRMKEVIIDGLGRFSKGNSVRDKYKWLKKYFNNVIDTLEFVPDPSDWYEGDSMHLYKTLRI